MLRDYDEAGEDEALAPLEYARRYGLIKNQLGTDPLSAADLMNDAHDLHVTSSLDPFTNACALPVYEGHEKMEVDKETAGLLASILALGGTSPRDTAHGIDCEFQMKCFKLEDPMLATDPEIDMWRLASRDRAVVSTSGIDPVILNGENGEGFEWSTKESDFHTNVIVSCETEVLEVDKHTMRYMVGLLMTPAGFRFNDMVDLAATERDALVDPSAPLTPPLIPLLPEPTPERLYGPAGEMTLTSTPEDICAIEAASLEQQILPDDDLETLHDLSTPGSGTANSPCVNTSTPSQIFSLSLSSSMRRKPWSRLRVDTPLIPTDSTETPAKKAKTVCFPADLYTIIPSSESRMEEDPDDFMNEVARPLAILANKQIEIERLIEIDTTMRIEVPQVDEIEFELPWKHSHSRGTASEPQRAAWNHAVEALLVGEKRWGGASRVEQLLPWAPFPSQWARVRTDEALDDAPLTRDMQGLTFEDRIDIEPLLWKPDRLAILDTHESDSDYDDLNCAIIDDSDVLEPSNHPTMLVAASAPQQSCTPESLPRSEPSKTEMTRMDMRTLLRKRKLELDPQSHPGQTAKRLQIGEPGDSLHRASDLTKASDFTGMNGLSTFMHLHGHAPKTQADIEPILPLRAEQNAPPAIMVQPKPMGESTETVVCEPLAAPEVRSSAESRSVVVSSSLLMCRRLIRQIQDYIPALDLIERDVIEPYSDNAGPGAKQNTANDADITISPSTGLIMTTLSKLKQKPLPGQTTFFGIHARIVAVASRYERLIILVNENRPALDREPSSTRQLDESDTKAISDLISFCTRLHTAIEVYYVAGGESGLAQWIAAVTSKHATPQADMKLLDDETMWERVLRSAGLNAYAAQVVLAALKTPDGLVRYDNSSALGRSEVEAHGLAAFMQMSGEERVERFGRCLGGDRVLRRANDELGREWQVR